MSVKQQVAEQEQQLRQAVSRALDMASAKSDQAEVAITKSTGISVSSRMGEVENVEFNQDGALGITVYCEQRKGSASTTDLSEKAIAKTVEAALEIASYTSPDPFGGPAPKALMAFDYPDLDLFYPDEPEPDTAAALAIEAEQAALNHDSRIKFSDGASYDSHYGVRVYGNSHGMLGSYPSSRQALSCSVIAESDAGMERDMSYTVARDKADLWTPTFVGVEAAKHAVARLNPRSVSTCQVPVMFDRSVATGLFGHLVMAISGSALYRKSSFLLDKKGEQIFPDWLTINELPHVRKGSASAPFDSEGVITQDRRIIEKGVLNTYLATSYAARKLGIRAA